MECTKTAKIRESYAHFLCVHWGNARIIRGFSQCTFLVHSITVLVRIITPGALSKKSRSVSIPKKVICGFLKSPKNNQDANPKNILFDLLCLKSFPIGKPVQ